jgi:hypothetical protein
VGESIPTGIPKCGGFSAARWRASLGMTLVWEAWTLWGFTGFGRADTDDAVLEMSGEWIRRCRFSLAAEVSSRPEA